jgi:hypothetical protein
MSSLYKRRYFHLFSTPLKEPPGFGREFEDEAAALHNGVGVLPNVKDVGGADPVNIRN